MSCCTTQKNAITRVIFYIENLCVYIVKNVLNVQTLNSTDHVLVDNFFLISLTYKFLDECCKIYL